MQICSSKKEEKNPATSAVVPTMPVGVQEPGFISKEPPTPGVYAQIPQAKNRGREPAATRNTGNGNLLSPSTMPFAFPLFVLFFSPETL